MLSLHLHLKITFSLQSLVHLSLVLKSSESLTKYGKMKNTSLVGNMKTSTAAVDPQHLKVKIAD